MSCCLTSVLMVNTRHRLNDYIELRARSCHSAAQIPWWLPVHPSKSQNSYSALVPVRCTPPPWIFNQFQPVPNTDHVPILLASLFCFRHVTLASGWGCLSWPLRVHLPQTQISMGIIHSFYKTSSACPFISRALLLQYFFPALLWQCWWSNN